ncbi:hypothetical protein CNR22_21345 [Sphingobacteriaceae bacterium]|nr:hypothetical protein CNR22_21345 [Sphingobacteriaceae bacterium]
MAAVYILFSKSLNKFYIGSCLDLNQRLLDHKNRTYVRSFTSIVDDWQLVYSIEELDGNLARKIEAHIKAMKSKKYIENLVKYPEIVIKLKEKF